jgi:type I restriction enzyme S subunit
MVTSGVTNSVPGWSRTTVGAVVQRITDRAGIGAGPYVEIGDIDVISKKIHFKSKVSPGHCLKATTNDVLVSKVRPTRGAISKLSTDAFVSPAFCVLRSQRIDPDFFYYVCTRIGLSKYLGIVETGTTYPSCDDADVLAYRFDFPEDWKEQQKIAEILATVDEAIELTDLAIEKHERIKQGLMQDLFRYGIDQSGSIRSNATGEYRDSPLGRIPKEWTVDGLAKVGSRIRPYIKTGPFGSALKGEHWTSSGIPVITIGSLGDGEFIDSELFYVSKDTGQRLGAYRVEPGDLVFSRVADVGRSVVISSREDGWIMSSNMMRISLDPNTADPFFLYINLVFNSSIRSQIRRLVNAGGREVANTDILNGIIFAWPRIEEQRAISALVVEYNKIIFNERSWRDKLLSFRYGLLGDLLSGGVRVNNLIS